MPSCQRCKPRKNPAESICLSSMFSYCTPPILLEVERVLRRCRKQHHKQQRETDSKLAIATVTVPLNVPNVFICSSLNKTVAPFNLLQTLLGRPAMPWLLRCIGVAFTAGQTVGPYDLVAVQLLEEAPGARQFGMSCCW